MNAAFRTSITRLLGIQTPVISAAMTGPSGGLLAAAVTKAGGFGFLSAGRATSADYVLHQIRIARVLLPVNSSSAHLPIGVGFFGFELDVEPRMVKILDSVLLQGVQAIWLSFGVDLGKWIKYIRDSERDRNAKRTLIFVQLPTSADAQKANSDWDIDAIVLQGSEAGGHSIDSATSIVSLVPETVNSITLPVLAAGGLVSGAHLASMLALGASGIVVGTRFSVATESLLPQNKKERLVAVQPSSDPLTYLSPIYDELIGRVWPPGTTARGLRMETMIKEKMDGLSIEERRRAYEENSHAGGTHEIIWAGTSVGQINKIEPAEDIVREIHNEALEVIQNMASTLNSSDVSK